MNKTVLLLLSMLLVPGLQSTAQMPDSVRRFVDSALHIMERHSVFSKQVDWKETRDEAFRLAESATTYAETLPALQYAFNRLNDKHGWLVIDGKEYRNPRFTPDTSRISANIKAAALKGPRIYQATIRDRYAYLSIPFFGGQSSKSMNDFANRLQDSLCKAVRPGIKGFIIDLRLNAGGNMFPMLVGISNVLGNGVIFESKDSHGNTIGKTEIRDYSFILLDTMLVRLSTPCGDFSRYPVAVLIGPVTGSAGECVAVGLKGRNNTKLFGETTAGFTSSNQGFLLPGSNNGIVIGVDFLQDKNGKVYLENVQPDTRVIGGDAFFNHEKDQKIRAAMKWLKKQG